MFKRKDEEANADLPTTPADPTSVLHDDLGLYHLWYLEIRMQEELVRGARIGSVFSLAAWQLHQLPGESMSREQYELAAQLITKSVRAYDISARLDATRFAALLLDASNEAASTVAFRLKSDLQVRLSALGRWRAGVASFPNDGVDGNALIQTAFRRLEGDARAA
jgi:hypothetical protein